MIVLSVNEEISYSTRSGPSVNYSQSEKCSGFTAITTDLPPLVYPPVGQFTRASATAKGDGNSIGIDLSGGAQSPDGLPSAKVSASATLSDVITILEAPPQLTTQVFELAVSGSADGIGTQSGTSRRFTFNGQQQDWPAPSIQKITLHEDLANPLPFTLELADQMLFGNGDGGGRSAEVVIQSITVLTSDGTPLSGFSYSTQSGNAYNVIGGTQAQQALTAT